MNDFTTTILLMIVPALFTVLAYVLSPIIKELTHKNFNKQKNKDSEEGEIFKNK